MSRKPGQADLEDIVLVRNWRPLLSRLGRLMLEVVIMNSTINVSILLQKKWRTPEGIERVKEIADSLEIRPSASGRASISGKIALESFVKLFQVSPIPVEPRSPGESDFGSPGGYTVETELEIPTQLKEYVEVISLDSPAVRLR